VVIRSGRHPHEVALLVACVLLGLAGLVAYGKVATTTIRGLPEPLGYLLYAGLLAGGVVALAGSFMPGLAGPLIERIGLASLGLLCVAYAVAVLAFFPTRGLSFAVFMLAFTAANVFRMRQISRELTELQAVEVVIGGKGDES
jgi:hypothetical protein